MDTNFQSQPRFNTAGAPSLYSLPQLDEMNKVYLQHRMTYRGASWPAGMNYGVAWDNAAHRLIDAYSPPSTQSCIWANGCDMRRYLSQRLLQFFPRNSCFL